MKGHYEEEIQRLFVEKGWTLSTAESCTGGRAAACLTSIAGASSYFLGGVVCYSNSLKMSLLRVSEKAMMEKGAVSREVVEEMLQGILAVAGSDFAIAVSGIAGPDGGTAEKPVGTVWCAVGKRGKAPHAFKLLLRGNRGEVIEQSVEALFRGLLAYAEGVGKG